MPPYLDGLSVETLESGILGKHLSTRGYESLATAFETNLQQGSFDKVGFATGLAECESPGLMSGVGR